MKEETLQSEELSFLLKSGENAFQVFPDGEIANIICTFIYSTIRDSEFANQGYSKEQEKFFQLSLNGEDDTKRFTQWISLVSSLREDNFLMKQKLEKVSYLENKVSYLENIVVSYENKVGSYENESKDLKIRVGSLENERKGEKKRI